MTQSKNFRQLVVFCLLALFILTGILACGPAVRNTEVAPSDESATPSSDESAISPNQAEIDNVMGERDAHGIPVGFTSEGYPYRGNPDAPIVIEEYSDYQCPYCARFQSQTLTGLDQNQIASGEVLFIFRDFPLTNIHPQAPAAANAARCAGEQSAVAYWDMHDALFADIGRWSNNSANEIFTDYGNDLGLEMESFTDCLATDKYGTAVQADLQSGRARGVTSTPSFFINDQPLVGAQPLAVFNQAIAAVQAGNTLPGQQASAPSPVTDQPIVVPTPAALSDETAAVLGNMNAPVTIIEFSDYQCPFCRRHSMETMPVIQEMIESGRVHYIFKDLPLDSIHPEARAAAVAARCAGDQDAYWEMHDLLFVNQAQWGGQGSTAANRMFTNYATEMDLNTANFTSCLNSGRYDAAVELNVSEATSLGIRGTPFFFVNGYPLNGAQPAQVFEYVVGLAEENQLGEAIAESMAEQQRQQQQQQQQQQQPTGPVEVPIGNAYAIGHANAPITIVEYTDFQCPFCQRHAQQTFPLILANYVEAGIVRYVFKDFPLTNIHPQAVKAAEAVRCAGDQDAFLEMHHVMFDKQEEWGGRNDVTTIFAGYARELGLEADSFDQCLSSNKYEAAVMADLQEGVSLGVSGTPAFFLNGYLISGAYPIDAFDQAIDSLLAEE